MKELFTPAHNDGLIRQKDQASGEMKITRIAGRWNLRSEPRSIPPHLTSGLLTRSLRRRLKLNDLVCVALRAHPLTTSPFADF